MILAGVEPTRIDYIGAGIQAICNTGSNSRSCRFSASASWRTSRASSLQLPHVLEQAVLRLSCAIVRTPSSTAERMSESVTELQIQMYIWSSCDTGNILNANENDCQLDLERAPMNMGRLY